VQVLNRSLKETRTPMQWGVRQNWIALPAAT